MDENQKGSHNKSRYVLYHISNQKTYLCNISLVVFEILLSVSEGISFKEAFEMTLPKRKEKISTVSESSQSENEEPSSDEQTKELITTPIDNSEDRTKIEMKIVPVEKTDQISDR